MSNLIIMKVLIVLTSHSELGDTGKKTGFWVEEFAAPYYELADAGVEITLASPKGGQPPIDPRSEEAAAQTQFTQRFDKDEPLKQKLAHTLKLSDVKASDYDAVFYPGGHGPLWDLTKDANSIALLEAFQQQAKPMALVCHAPLTLPPNEPTPHDPDTSPARAGIAPRTSVRKTRLCICSQSSRIACDQMKVPTLTLPRSKMMWGILLLTASCAPQYAVEKHDHRAVSFARVKPVLEHSCVHCHGANRLPGMPSLTDTRALAGLIGTGNLIVPGKPGQSRFYVVATLSDYQAGAMPPTGHALSPEDANILKEWIQNGATLPAETVKLEPKGISPRSR